MIFHQKQIDPSNLIGSAYKVRSDALITPNTAMSYDECSVLSTRYKTLIASLFLENDHPVIVEAKKSFEAIALITALRTFNLPVMILPVGMGEKAKRTVAQTAGANKELSLVKGELQVQTLETKYGSAPKQAREAAFILTTSGSTGIPKGVCLPQISLTAFTDWAKKTFNLQSESRVLSFAPLNFDLSLLEVWATLDAGGTVALADEKLASDAHRLASFVQDAKINILQGVPLLYRLLTSHPKAIFPSVRHLIVTGEATPHSLRQRLVECFPNARFHNIYGSTETNNSFFLSCDHQHFSALEKLPIGWSIAGCAHRLVNDEGDEIIGAGEGELHTSTPFMAGGYTDDGLTQSAFYMHETEAGPKRFYQTGDMAQREEDGTLKLIGRRDHIVKVRGIRTNLLDIETALEIHDSVDAAVVCPLTEEDGNIRLLAVVQAPTGVSPLDLRQHCAARLPRSAIPKQFTLIDQPLPRTSTGKPDRVKVAALYT